MKVLNFGSLNIDYVYRVHHFVRAGETIASRSMETFSGGKGLNQSVAFAKAGARVFHAGAVGAEGKMLTDILRRSGADTSFVRTLEHIPSGHAIIQVNDEGENCIMLCGGANQTQDEPFINEVLSHFDAGDLLMLQNEINDPALIAKKAKGKGLLVALNPSPMNEAITEELLSYVDFLILNETEGKEITGKEDKEEILSELRRRYPEMKIILTLGSRGSLYEDEGGRVTQSIFKVTPVDTTAAGDTFTGFFFTSLLGGKSPAESLRVASAASALAVSRMGAAPSIPTMDEVDQFLKSM